MTTLYRYPFDKLLLLRYKEFLNYDVITLLDEHTPLTPDQVQALKDFVATLQEPACPTPK